MYVGINSDILCVSLRSWPLPIGIFNLFDVITLSIFWIRIFCSRRNERTERVRARVIRISRRLPHCLFQSRTQYFYYATV